jgi:hypothetical protein
MESECLAAFSELYPLPWQIHLTITPPRYSVNGTIHNGTNSSGNCNPYFPEKSGKVNAWLIQYILNPLQKGLRWDQPACNLYGLVVIAPAQPDKPLHAHVGLCADNAIINAALVTSLCDALELNRHTPNDDSHFSYTPTTLLAKNIHAGTADYIFEHLLEADHVATLHRFNKQHYPTI